MPELVVYTCIMGKIGDRLYPPHRWPEHRDFRLVCFTDQTETVRREKSWEVRPPSYTHPVPRRAARAHKVLAHELFPDAAWTLWIDGCLTPNDDPAKILTAHEKHSLAVFKHEERGCLYEELEACIRLKKDDPSLMRKQVDTYRKRGYPEKNGLAETTALLRKRSSATEKLNKAWWREIEQGSLRDQLSFDYVAWQLKITYAHLQGGRTKSPYFSFRPHR